MIPDFERYHGVALRSIIVESPKPLTIRRCDETGRVNSFMLDECIGVHIKHSAKRLPPWSFSFTVDQLRELVELRRKASSVWLLLVCGPDGIVCLSIEEFASITASRPGGVASVRVDRGRREQYRVYGNEGELATAKPNGIVPLVEALQGGGTDTAARLA